MIIAISRFQVDRQEAERISGLFRTRSHRVEDHEGFLGLEVLRSGGPRPEFLLVTRWSCRESLRSYLRSADFRAVHRNNEEQQADFNIYEVVST